MGDARRPRCARRTSATSSRSSWSTGPRTGRRPRTGGRLRARRLRDLSAQLARDPQGVRRLHGSGRQALRPGRRSFWRKPKVRRPGPSPGPLGPIDPCTIDPSLPGCSPPPPDRMRRRPDLPGCAPRPDRPGTIPPPPPPPTTPPGRTSRPAAAARRTRSGSGRSGTSRTPPSTSRRRSTSRNTRKLLKAASDAIKKVDPKADVVLGGMWGPDSAKKVSRRSRTT